MRLNPRLRRLAVAVCASLLASRAVVHGSEVCLRTLTAKCEDGKTACLEDCFGRVLDDLEYIEAQDADEDTEIQPPMNLAGDDALGISVDYALGDERLVIDSLPKFTHWLYISNLHLSSESSLVIPDSVKKLRNVYLSGSEISSLAGVALPDSVQLFSVFQSALTTLSGVEFPSTLRTLYAAENAITSIAEAEFPSKLTSLDLHSNALGSLDGVKLPDSLKSLDLSTNNLQRLADIAFPKTLELLDLSDNRLMEISNVTFPATGSAKVSLQSNGIRSIRLTEVQWDAFERAFEESKALVLETRPTSVTECTTGHFVDGDDGKKPSTEFTACLLSK